MAQTQDRPVHEIRLGRIKAAIWRNDTEVGVRYGVTLSRIYKTENGWESSSSFGRDDLPLVAKVADLAHTWVYQQNDRNDEVAESDDSKTDRARSNSNRSTKQTARR